MIFNMTTNQERQHATQFEWDTELFLTEFEPTPPSREYVRMTELAAQVSAGADTRAEVELFRLCEEVMG